jgi:hypothetical protein
MADDGGRKFELSRDEYDKLTARLQELEVENKQLTEALARAQAPGMSTGTAFWYVLLAFFIGVVLGPHLMGWSNSGWR